MQCSNILRRAIYRPTAVARLSTISNVAAAASSSKWSPGRLIGVVGTASRAPPMTTTTSRFFSSSSDKLLDLLAREYDEEKDNNSTDMPEALETLKDQLSKTWKIVDAGALTKMHKTVGSYKVQVSFHCQDDTGPYSEEDDGGAEDEEGGDEEEPSPAVRFTVTATKAGKSLVLTCVSEDSMAYIKSAAMSNTDVDVLHTTGIDASSYQGPEFSELAEDLQEAFHGFLEEEIGINDDVAAFIAMYFDYQEQCQYVKFLEDAKGILA